MIGSIAEDKTYVDFLEKQESLFDVNQAQVKEMIEDSGLTAVQVKSTPLLDSIRDKRAKKQQKAKERREKKEFKINVTLSEDKNKAQSQVNEDKKKKRSRKPKPKKPAKSDDKLNEKQIDPSKVRIKQKPSSSTEDGKKSADFPKAPKFLLVKKDGTTHAIG